MTRRHLRSRLGRSAPRLLPWRNRPLGGAAIVLRGRVLLRVRGGLALR